MAFTPRRAKLRPMSAPVLGPAPAPLAVPETGASALPNPHLSAHYLQRPAPLLFPESAEVPVSQLHLDLRTLLYLLLQDYLGETRTVGSNQFVYWDAADPARCLAPDAYVKCTPPGEPVRSWKVWERGAPDVAVEIISDSDSSEAQWSQKLTAYQSLGVQELVRVDLLSPEAASLRLWNRLDGVLAERQVLQAAAPSLVLPLTWVLAPAPLSRETHRLPLALRIAKRDNAADLVLTSTEARVAEAQTRVAETARADAAQARVAELEAQLALLGKG